MDVPDLIWHFLIAWFVAGAVALLQSTVLQMDPYEWKAVMNLLWHQEDRALQDALGHHWLPWDRWHR